MTIAHSDPCRYNNSLATAATPLKDVSSVSPGFGVVSPPRTPPVPEGAQTSAPPSGNGIQDARKGPDARNASGVRAPSPRQETVHDFASSKAIGSLGPCQLESLFQQAVPGYEGHKVATLAQDKDGVDYWLAVTGEPRLVPCQLKIRPYRKRLSDVLVELAHIGPRRVWPGWIQDRPARVFLYYLPTPKRCLVCNGHELAAAWRKHGLAWADHFGVRLARNADYTTVSVPVPVAEVRAACPSARVLEVRV